MSDTTDPENQPPAARSGRRRRVLALVTLAIALALAALVAEVALRLTRPTITPDSHRRQSLEFEPTVFARHAFPRQEQHKRTEASPWNDGRPWEARIGPLGYRGDFELRKPEGTRRVVVLGGSAAFDIFALDGEDWPSLVERELHRLGRRDVEVINAATPGHATWDSLGRLYSEIWMLDPDAVVVYHCWNDLKYFGWLAPEQSLLRGFRPMPAAPGLDPPRVDNPYMYPRGALDRLLSHSQIYVRLRARYWTWKLGRRSLEGAIGLEGEETGAEELPDTFGPWGPRQYELTLALLVEAAREIGALPVLLTQGRLAAPDNDEADRRRIDYARVGLSHEGLLAGFAACDERIAEVARRKDVPALDVGARVTGESELWADHIHPSAAGSRALARVIAPFLDRVLPQGAGEEEEAAASEAAATATEAEPEAEPTAAAAGGHG